MPGTYAHMTLVDTLCSGEVLDSIGTLDRSVIYALLTWPEYCRLGAVTPDYPYLSYPDFNAEGWANGMHYFHSRDFVERALRQLMNYRYEDAAAEKGIAWLFGFVAHVVADVSMHPVINAIVGNYEDNKEEHRRCEAHQDAHIFTAMQLRDINKAEYISNSRITKCTVGGKLDPDISGLWQDCLSVIHKDREVKTGVHGPTGNADIDSWHSRFVFVMNRFAEEVGQLPLICRMFDEVLGIGYPHPEHLDGKYIHKLPTPTGTPMEYDDLFTWTQENVKRAWGNLGDVLRNRDERLLDLPNADLDLGMTIAQKSIYWSEELA